MQLARTGVGPKPGGFCRECSRATGAGNARWRARGHWQRYSPGFRPRCVCLAWVLLIALHPAGLQLVFCCSLSTHITVFVRWPLSATVHNNNGDGFTVAVNQARCDCARCSGLRRVNLCFTVLVAKHQLCPSTRVCRKYSQRSAYRDEVLHFAYSYGFVNLGRGLPCSMI